MPYLYIAKTRGKKSKCRHRELCRVVEEDVSLKHYQQKNNKAGYSLYVDPSQEPKEHDLQQIKLKPGFKFVPLPTPLNDEGYGRDISFVVARSGSGKSFFMKNMALEYLERNPNGKVVIIADVDVDDSFKSLEYHDDPGKPRDPNKPIPEDAKKRKNVIRIPLTQDFWENSDVTNIMQDSWANTYCIFDDIETIKNRIVKAGVLNLLRAIVTRGRGRSKGENGICNRGNISAALCAHNMRCGRTKELLLVLLECNRSVVFPRFSIKTRLIDYLNQYVGIDESVKYINYLKKLNSRWVMFDNHPGTGIIVVSKYMCEIYDKDDDDRPDLSKQQEMKRLKIEKKIRDVSKRSSKKKPSNEHKLPPRQIKEKRGLSKK